MKTIIYKNGNTVCEVKHEGKKVISISGCEKDRISALFKKRKGREYIWKALIEFIDVETGYTIETGGG